ncbi:hypothetical protein [uncultured Weissella sp.]|uniref:hypothetical protein n=1 Tax=uncultured Weissella sp. TaxID=253243 RepID=UPI00258A210F|nr:hypothetical protein [uncultured Weissella sp.]
MLFTKKETKQQSAILQKVTDMHGAITTQQAEIKSLETEIRELEEKVHDTSLSVSEVVDMKRQIADKKLLLETLNQRLSASILSVDEARELISKIVKTEKTEYYESREKVKQAMIDLNESIYECAKVADKNEQHLRHFTYMVNDITIRVGDYQKDLNANDYMPRVRVPNLLKTARDLQQEYKL